MKLLDISDLRAINHSSGSSLSLPSAIKHSGGLSGISPLNDSYVDDPLLLSPY